MRESEKETLTAKAIGLGVALAAAWVAHQVIGRAWQATFGHKPPLPENPGDARFGEIAAAATITGAVVALTRVLATRGAARFIK